MTLRLGILLAILALAVPRGVRGADPSTMTLRDGRVITGEILSMSGGVYSIRSDILGTVTVSASDVLTLTNGPPAAAGAAPAPPVPQLDALQQQMASDPETMKDITALQDSPEMQAVLDDPEVQSALRSGNLQALLSNPKIARLASDPRIQRIADKYGR